MIRFRFEIDIYWIKKEEIFSQKSQIGTLQQVTICNKDSIFVGGTFIEGKIIKVNGNYEFNVISGKYCN